MSNIPLCKNTWSQHANYHAGDTYGDYCPECHYAGVPEMEAEINRLKDQLVSVFCVQAEEERQRGRKALHWLQENYHWLVPTRSR